MNKGPLILLFAVLSVSAVYLNHRALVLEENQRKGGATFAYRPSQKETPFPAPTTRPEVKSQQIVAKPSPTPDPDPIVICKSKTGDIQVRRSVCRSHTDCPDGSGGYIFESQEDCKKRMERLGQELADVVGQWADAHLESSKLELELKILEAENKFYDSLLETQKETQRLIEAIPEPSFSPGLPKIKLEEPTPKPKPNYEGTIVY